MKVRSLFSLRRKYLDSAEEKESGTPEALDKVRVVARGFLWLCAVVKPDM